MNKKRKNVKNSMPVLEELVKLQTIAIIIQEEYLNTDAYLKCVCIKASKNNQKLELFKIYEHLKHNCMSDFKVSD